MHRKPLSILLFLVILFASLGLSAFRARAQADHPALCTPSQPPVEFTSDVSSELLARGDPAEVDSRTSFLFGFTFQPHEAGEPNGVPEDCYNEPVTATVLWGELTIVVTEGTGYVSRAATIGAVLPEEITSGTEATLQAGDSLFIERAIYSLHNNGSGSTAVIVSTLAGEFGGCPCSTWPT